MADEEVVRCAALYPPRTYTGQRHKKAGQQCKHPARVGALCVIHADLLRRGHFGAGMPAKWRYGLVLYSAQDAAAADAPDGRQVG